MNYGFRETNEKQYDVELMVMRWRESVMRVSKTFFEKQNEGEDILLKTRLRPDGSKQIQKAG